MFFMRKIAWLFQQNFENKILPTQNLTEFMRAQNLKMHNDLHWKLRIVINEWDFNFHKCPFGVK